MLIFLALFLILFTHSLAMLTDKKNIINQLRKEILQLEGFKSVSQGSVIHGLNSIESAFPNQVFPTGTLHEFVAAGEQTSACLGFMNSLLSSLMNNGGICLWISTSRAVFPSALKALGVTPERIIFIDLERERDVLWATEEGLKCNGLNVVVSELREINFTQSRRLQLAAEKSGVTGFILIKDSHRINTTPCTARWQVKSIQSKSEEGLPGLGFPRWEVELLKVRNGNPAKWQFEWSGEKLRLLENQVNQELIIAKERKAG